MGRPATKPKFKFSRCIVCGNRFRQLRAKSQRKTCGDECYSATRPKFDMQLTKIKNMKIERRKYLKQHYESPIHNVINI